MQTQKQTPSSSETNKPAETIDAEIAKARASLGSLLLVVDDKAAEAKKAGIAFEREPTEQAAVQKLVAEQRAKNAQAEAETFERDTLNTLLAKKAAAEEDAEREKLRGQMALSLVQEPLDRMQAAIETCARELEEASRELADALLHRHQYHARATSLGLRVDVLKYDDLIDRLSGRLRSKLHSGADTDRTEIRLVVGGSTNSGNLHLAMSRPINVPGQVRH